MIYALAYAAVALFCWGWIFPLADALTRRIDPEMAILFPEESYHENALVSALAAVIWPICLLMEAWSQQWLWHGWRLPYLERIWRK